MKYCGTHKNLDSLEGVEAFVYVEKDKLAVILRWQGALFEELREDSEKFLDRWKLVSRLGGNVEIGKQAHIHEMTCDIQSSTHSWDE